MAKIKNIVPLRRPARDAAVSNPQLTYRGGPLIQNVEVSTIYWGNEWNTSLTQTQKNLDKFFTYIVTTPLIDQLSEYNTNGYKIGHGRHLATDIVGASGPPPKPKGCLGFLFPNKADAIEFPFVSSTVTDTDIQNLIVQELNNGHIPAVTSDSLYFVFTPPGTAVTLGTDSSCSTFCGYHSNSNNLYYAVIPYPDCAGCLGTANVFDALTEVATHELCEAITDPIPGQGWYDDNNGEIGDICAWHTKQLGGYSVQLEWSNKAGSCV